LVHTDIAGATNVDPAPDKLVAPPSIFGIVLG
jgi:hypothetical protein